MHRLDGDIDQGLASYCIWWKCSAGTTCSLMKIWFYRIIIITLTFYRSYASASGDV